MTRHDHAGDPAAPHDASGAVLRRPHRRHRAGTGTIGAASTALGLLIAANRQMAGPSGGGDPGPLALGTDLRWRSCITPGSASRPRHWRTISPMSGQRCAGSPRSTICRSTGCAFRPSGRRFCDRVDKRIRQRLYNLIRYCSARRIGPSSVDDKLFDEYWHYRTETTARACKQHRPPLYGAGVECLCGRTRRLAAAAAHRAAAQDD